MVDFVSASMVSCDIPFMRAFSVLYCVFSKVIKLFTEPWPMPS
jgi:hypothetical protein